MKQRTNAVLDQVLRRERIRKVKLYAGLAVVVLLVGAIMIYTQFKLGAQTPVDKPFSATTLIESKSAPDNE